jgi:hypothetical protein
LAKGQDVNRQVLQRVVQERIDALEKKGRRCGSVAVADRARTAARGSGRS